MNPFPINANWNDWTIDLIELWSDPCELHHKVGNPGPEGYEFFLPALEVCADWKGPTSFAQLGLN